MHGEMPAGDIRTSHFEDNANEAGSQQLTPRRNVDGPILDKRLAVVEIQLGGITFLAVTNINKSKGHI